MNTPTEKEITRNKRFVESAIAQQRLEGLEVPAAAVADLNKIAAGEIDVEKAMSNFRRRYQHGPLREG